jgi:hypothetical protein
MFILNKKTFFQINKKKIVKFILYLKAINFVHEFIVRIVMRFNIFNYLHLNN